VKIPLTMFNPQTADETIGAQADIINAVQAL
jgi:hypothetical protein